LRILLAHNAYTELGGEDSVVANERALLLTRGHAVELLLLSNADLHGHFEKSWAIWRAPYSQQGRKRMATAIAAFRPDIVHVHNFFFRLTPAVYDACAEAGVPVVQTLHNFRLFCAAATLFRAGKVCEDCLGRSPWRGAFHGCWRGSRLGSLAVARMIDIQRRRNTWNTKVDRFIALTAFARDKFVAAGLPPDKIVVKPNFVADPGPPPPGAENARAGALFVGRLSPEKGITTLLASWASIDLLLSIVGDGPLRSLVEASVGTNIGYGGGLAAERVREAMRSARFLVMPSECYENLPMVIAEAFANGLPVVASRLGAMAEIIEDGQTGLLFTPGDPDDLAEKVRWAVAHPIEMRFMGGRARQVYEKRYTPDANYQRLLTIYAEAVREYRSRGAERTL
jgi:glycosyltransferase involved in cell wall biosynthesis